MTQAEAHWDQMETLAQAQTCLIVDFIPYTPIGETFAPLEVYMEEHYRATHAEKMVMLLLLLAYRYPSSVIYVEDDSDMMYEDHPELAHNLDVRHFDPERIAGYIREIIIDERPVSLSVFIPESNCLMRITGGFSNEIYGEDNEFHALVATLAQQQGLFIREVPNDY